MRNIFFFALATGLVTIGGLAAPAPRTRALDAYCDKLDIRDCPLVKRGDNNQQAAALRPHLTSSSCRPDSEVAQGQGQEAQEAKRAAKHAKDRANYARASLDSDQALKRRTKWAADKRSQRARDRKIPGKVEAQRKADAQRRQAKTNKRTVPRVARAPRTQPYAGTQARLAWRRKRYADNMEEPAFRATQAERQRRYRASKKISKSQPLVTSLAGPPAQEAAASAVPPSPASSQVEHLDAEHGSPSLPHTAASAVPPYQVSSAFGVDAEHGSSFLPHAAASAVPLHQVSPASSRPIAEHVDAEHGSRSLPQAPVWRTIPAFRPNQAGVSPFQNQVWGGSTKEHI